VFSGGEASSNSAGRPNPPRGLLERSREFPLVFISMHAVSVYTADRHYKRTRLCQNFSSVPLVLQQIRLRLWRWNLRRRYDIHFSFRPAGFSTSRKFTLPSPIAIAKQPGSARSCQSSRALLRGVPCCHVADFSGLRRSPGLRVARIDFRGLQSHVQRSLGARFALYNRHVGLAASKVVCSGNYARMFVYNLKIVFPQHVVEGHQLQRELANSPLSLPRRNSLPLRRFAADQAGLPCAAIATRFAAFLLGAPGALRSHLKGCSAASHSCCAKLPLVLPPFKLQDALSEIGQSSIALGN